MLFSSLDQMTFWLKTDLIQSSNTTAKFYPLLRCTLISIYLTIIIINVKVGKPHKSQRIQKKYKIKSNNPSFIDNYQLCYQLKVIYVETQCILVDYGYNFQSRLI